MQIEVYDKLNNPIDAISKMGEFFAKSGMFGCERVEQGQVLALACIAEKKSPFEIKRTYHLMNGELTMRADAMLAELRKRGGKHRVIKRTPDVAHIEVTHDGQTIESALSWEEAQAEPFVRTKDGKFKKNWATPRARMQTMWARVVSDAVRTIAPEIVSGTYAPEEVGDDVAQTPAPSINLQAGPRTPETSRRPTGSGLPVVDAEVQPATTSEDNREETRENRAASVQESQASGSQRDRDEVAEAAAGLAPAQPASTEPKPAPTSAGEMATQEEFLQLGQILDEVPGRFDVAMKWFLKEGWLQPGESVAALPRPRVLRVIKQKASWVRAIDAFGATLKATAQ